MIALTDSLLLTYSASEPSGDSRLSKLKSPIYLSSVVLNLVRSL